MAPASVVAVVARVAGDAAAPGSALAGLVSVLAGVVSVVGLLGRVVLVLVLVAGLGCGGGRRGGAGVVPGVVAAAGAVRLGGTALDVPRRARSLGVMLTGVLLWLAGLASGLADNWFALRRMREALAHQRRLVHALGMLRAQRFAAWMEAHVADIAGSVALALLLGFAPVLARFFGVPLEVRHVTLAAGELMAAGGSLGWRVLAEPAFWLALAGVLATGIANVAVAFACALALALHARGVPQRQRRRLVRTLLRRMATQPLGYLLSVQNEALPPAQRDEKEGAPAPRARRR
jgi:site-specific recombinase